MKLGAMGLLVVLGVSVGCAEKSHSQLRREAVRDSVDKNYRSPEGFQTVRWGMTPEEVRTALPDASVAPDGTLRMKTTVANMPAEVALGFLESQLAAVDVFFLEVTDARTFQALMKDVLTRKFGDPKTPHQLARQLKRGEAPVRFATELTPPREGTPAETLERELTAKGEFTVLERWTTEESHVNLTQWTLSSRSLMALQYEAAKYAPKRASIIGRTTNQARENLVKDL
ncbi:hypothetical protein JYK02_14225 [Corallococcus macrosporus]|uniref:Lipoprotein n=1 Tax=Corallococcus macrosporus TaxID=35 RepID=A0ABS3DAE9_9BACT|nr:hypothetical protein [Corallococcus macrosporus]MBN8228666.1 hypothetical protein [Corallococcus macrosporus]